MSRDSGIKLFGMTIQMQGVDDHCCFRDRSCLAAEESSLNCGGEDEELKKNEDGDELDGCEDDQETVPLEMEELRDNVDVDGAETAEVSKPEEEEEEEDKSLRKPDKIIPCPRCESMDTKFCYFNNYSVNQPRHFCKNCQRYWTSGGTMRNMAIGAGRRKSKNSTSHLQNHHSTAVESFKNNARADHDLPNGKVLNDSIEKSSRNGEEQSTKYHCFAPPHLPCFPWPYPSNAVQWSSAFPPGFAIPFYPPPHYWTSPWNVPLQGSNSPTLGKHSRDEKDCDSEKSLWVPKTLRVDDPEDAAKSSIWTTLGLRNDKVDLISRGAFKAFKLKDSERPRVARTCVALEANPAALSRSLSFHESS